MPRRLPAEDRKADIVASVLRLADRIGPDRLTTNDVAREVGVTQAAIFRHFPTKAALWLAVADTIAAGMDAAWKQALAEADAPAARLRALVLAQLRQIEANPALPAILHSRELNAGDAALRERFGGVLTRFQGLLVDNLAALQAQGALHARLQPRDAAVLLIALVQGVAIRWSLGTRAFAIVPEGRRLLEVQMALFGAEGEHNDT